MSASDEVIQALAEWHVTQIVHLERQLAAWQSIGRAAIQALDNHMVESRRMHDESSPARTRGLPDGYRPDATDGAP